MPPYMPLCRDIRADSRFTHSQLETTLLCNDVSVWLGASLELALTDMNRLYTEYSWQWSLKYNHTCIKSLLIPHEWNLFSYNIQLNEAESRMCVSVEQSNIQIMSCRLFSAKPLSEPTLDFVIWTTGDNFQWHLNKIHRFSYKKIDLKTSSARWWPFFLGLGALISWAPHPAVLLTCNKSDQCIIFERQLHGYYIYDISIRYGR